MNGPDPRTDGWSGVPPRTTTAVDGREARVDPDASVDPAGGAAAGSGAAGTAGTAGVSSAAGRPAPQYGEYAPEGWVNPVLVEQERQEQRDRDHAAASAVASAARSNGTSERPKRTAERSPQGERRTATTPRDGAPIRRLGASPVDVLLTFVLLAMGLVSVVQSLSIGSVASTVRQTLETNYTELQDPGTLNGAAMISAIGMLVVFALVLWWSVVRLRAGRRTFWVPLLGGAVATVFSSIVFVIVVFQDDGFVAAMMRQASGG
ncbi:DUF6264 family protein [Curtobacterium sp. MCBD17_030]|uniref:DUF6264 family protein n=1 Tax=Curtobacterium sp. MCBD17_030 TaxID=2175649 RepID=UPI000D9D80E3|nr:DUF6264 family protein [Curtobacterium sp. MCBD17_030]PYY35500.1 hypothetical protein DEI89_07070 [Curtobacterium sp. MCBD17_030]